MPEFTENVAAPAEVSLTDDLAQERVLDLSDMADEPGGALAPGWYSFDIIEGYSTRKGTQFVTEDTISKDGASHNSRICLSIKPIKGDPRNLQTSFNYRTSDFSPERIQHIKEMRAELKQVKQWPDRDAQRTSLALARLGQLGKATKVGVPLTSDNTLIPAKFIGSGGDVRVIIDSNGYNEAVEYAEAGTRAPRPPAKS